MDAAIEWWCMDRLNRKVMTREELDVAWKELEVECERLSGEYPLVSRKLTPWKHEHVNDKDALLHVSDVLGYMAYLINE